MAPRDATPELCCHASVQFNHYGGEASRLAADLVNAQWPSTPTALQTTLQRRGVVVTAVTADQLPELTGWAARLGECFGPMEVADLCGRVNGLLACAASQPRISLHDGIPHLHYSRQDGELVAHVRAMTATGLAYIACFASPGRLGRCARPGCSRAFVDTSRNGRRTYCSARCGNTEAVSRHRKGAGRSDATALPSRLHH